MDLSATGPSTPGGSTKSSGATMTTDFGSSSSEPMVASVDALAESEGLVATAESGRGILCEDDDEADAATAVCRRMPGALAAAAKPPPLLPATALGPADAWLVARQCISSSERRGGAKSRSPKAGLLEERGEREPVERRGKKVSSPRSLSRFTKNFPLASKSFLLLFFSRQQFSALLLLEPLPPDL